MTREEQLAELGRRVEQKAALAERERRCLELRDSYYLHYEIGDTQLTIRFARLKLMTIPYSQIMEIEVASIFANRFAQINLGNRTGKMCRIRKSRGWFRYVIISPRDPKNLMNAFHRFRSLADPVTEMSESNAPLPPFLQPHDDVQ